MNDRPYSLLLSASNNAEATRAAKLLDDAGFDYDRASVSYWEPRLRFRVGDDTHHSEVIGLLEIKEVIPYILEEIDK